MYFCFCFVQAYDPTGEIARYVSDLNSQLDNRLGRIDTDPLYIAATLLDPNRKMDWCGFGSADRSDQEVTVKSLMKSLMSLIVLDSPIKLGLTETAIAPKSVFDFMRRERSVIPAADPGYLSVDAEIEAYLSEQSRPPTGRDWNPLDFWKAHAGKFKRLGSLAKEILCATATTAGVERVFSIAGLLLSDRRLRTGDVNFETLLFCNINKDLIRVIQKRKMPDSN